MLNNNLLLTRKQVAEMLHVHPLTVKRWASAGRLTPIKLSATTIRYRQCDVEALIAATTVPKQ